MSYFIDFINSYLKVVILLVIFILHMGQKTCLIEDEMIGMPLLKHLKSKIIIR